MKLILVIATLAAVFLVGCQEEAAIAPPGPIAMTPAAVGHFCQMDVLEHDGPKAQIHVAKYDQPLWFSQVRDAVAFMRLPEETAEVLAVYVSDMGKAANWADPGPENWVDANKAHFVIKSRMTGGMGVQEAVPFGDLKTANTFAKKNGGTVVRLAEIPDDYVLGPVDVSSALSLRKGTPQ